MLSLKSKFQQCKFGTIVQSWKNCKQIVLKSFSTTQNKLFSTTLAKRYTSNMEDSDSPIVAVAQMCSTNDKEHNMRDVELCVEAANKKNAKMLFLPECCDFVGENRAETLALAEPLSGKTMQQYCQLARDNCMWLSLGGIHETIYSEKDEKEKSNKIHNSHVIIDNEGKIVCVYRKLHLFDVDTPEFRFRESDVVTAGSIIVPPTHTPVGALGLQICYDMRFAEPSVILRKAGAQLLSYPSAFAYTTGQSHWEILLRARAIETQCFVVAAAQTGWHNKKRRSWGQAMIIDPWGKVIIECDAKDGVTVATSVINLSQVQETRCKMPCFEHRRNEVYALSGYSMGSTKTREDRYFAKNIIDNRTIFYESEHSFAFTNLRCVLQGHVLVSTKRSTPRLNGLTSQEMADLFLTVCRIQRMLEAYYKTSSATVTVQDGEEAGQTVPHVHFHIMPRRAGDFKENDQIYEKLDDQKHERPDRTLEERIQEAEIYRQALNNQPV